MLCAKKRWAASLAATTALVLPLLAVAGENRIPVRAPDVFGGWASNHVIVRVVPGVHPVRRADGQVTLAPEGKQVGPASAELADVLAHWHVGAITPTARPAPKNAALARRIGLDRYYTLHLPAGTDTPALAARLAAFSGLIERAELDGVGGMLQTIPNDPSFGEQWGLNNTGQTVHGDPGTADADIDAPEAWDLETGGDDVIIAIIDSGVSYSHPDLAAKLVPGWNVQAGNDDADDSWYISHGTHCAGIAAAIGDNNEGICGVSWGARIMPVKVLNTFGNGTETDCGNGVIWAADHGAKVGSMSLGFTQGSSFFHDAIIYGHDAGMVLCVATGNTPGVPIFYPARWPETIAVGATDNDDVLADFTTTGPEMSVVAPGVEIYSCWDTATKPNTYVYDGGTSMACPHVSGLAALIFSANPDLTNDQVRYLIESTADDLGTPGWDEEYGWGRINAFAAVSAAIQPHVDGDIDGDGDVDLQDLSLLLASYGSCAGDVNYLPEADIDDSGCVDLQDLSLLLANYGYGT